MKVAAYQMSVDACYEPHGIESLRACVRECERVGVAMLCCPEGAIGGLADYVDDPEDIALSVERGALERALAPLASDSVTVVVGFTEADDAGRLYNAAAVYARGEVRGVYRKRHPAIRRSRYSAGSDAPVFSVDGVAFGILICRDSTDTALAADLVARGAEALFIPTNNAMPASRGGVALVREANDIDLQHAMELDVPIIRADVVGETRGLVSAGASAITAANGAQKCAAGIGPSELLVSEVALRPALKP
jgi:predicted amidohydrolase